MTTVKEISLEEARRIQYDVQLYIWEDWGAWSASYVTPEHRRNGLWGNCYDNENDYWATHRDIGTQYGIAVDDTKPEYEPT